MARGFWSFFLSPWFRRGLRKPAKPVARHNMALEALEAREVPATLTLTSIGGINTLSYVADAQAGNANKLSVFYAPIDSTKGTITFTDYGEKITTAITGFTGSGGATVSGLISTTTAKALLIDLGANTGDALYLGSQGAGTAWNATPFSQAGGAITLKSGGSITADQVTLTTPTLSLSAGSGIGSYDTSFNMLVPLRSATSNLSAKNTGAGSTPGGIYIANTGNVTLVGDGINNNTGNSTSQVVLMNTGNVTIDKNTAVISSTGTITLTADKNGTSPGSFTTSYSDPSTPVAGVKSDKGEVIIAANAMTFGNAKTSVSASGTITLTTADPARVIQLGSIDNTKLSFTTGHLSKISSGSLLRIGSNNALPAGGIAPANTAGITVANIFGGIATASNYQDTLSLVTAGSVTGSGSIVVNKLAVRAAGTTIIGPSTVGIGLGGTNQVDQFAAENLSATGQLSFISTSKNLVIPNSPIDGLTGVINSGQTFATITVPTSHNLTIEGPTKAGTLSLTAGRNGIGSIALNTDLTDVDRLVLQPQSLVTINGPRVVTGVVELKSGQFNLGTNNLTINKGRTNPGNLVLAASGTGKIYIGSATVNIQGTLAVGKGTTFSGDTGNIITTNVQFDLGSTLTAPDKTGSFTVSGNWTGTLTGTEFNNNSGIVTFTGASNTIKGSSNFNSLVKTATTASEMLFAPNTAQNTNNLTLKGAPGQLLTLKSSVTPGSKWILNKVSPAGSMDVRYVKVSDGFSQTAIDTIDSVNVVNNINWRFYSMPTITTEVSAPAVAVGTPVTLTANLTSSNGTPGGSVDFKMGDVTLGTGTIDANGKATLTTSKLPAGTFSITANYAGDNIKYVPAVSSAVALQVGGTQLPPQNQGYGAVWVNNSGISNGEFSAQQNVVAALGPNGTISVTGSIYFGGSGAPTGTGYTQIVSSPGAFAALKADGSIFGWGHTFYGGSGAPAGTGFTKIFSSYGAFAALKSDGSISVWGNTTNYPRLVSDAPAGTGYTNIFPNGNAFAALKADGSISAWGDSSNGGSGAPTGTGYTRIFSNLSAFAAMKADGSIFAWGGQYNGGKDAPTGNGFVQVYPNYSGFTAVRADGSLVTWGGFITGTPAGTGFTQVTGNFTIFAALNADGSISTWGYPTYGDRGAPSPQGNDFKAVFSNPKAMAALKTDGSISVWGDTNYGGSNAPTGTGYTRIFSNTNGFMAMKADGSLATWGSGVSNTPPGTGYTQVTATSGTFAAMKADGTIFVTSPSLTSPRTAGFTTFANPSVSLPVWQDAVSGTLPTAYVGVGLAQSGVNGVNGYQVGAYGLGMASAVTAGALPAGVSLNAATGFLTGAPTTAGTYSFTITSTNDAGTASKAFTLEVLAVPGVTVTPAAPANVFDLAVSDTMSGTKNNPLTPANLAVANTAGYKFEITLGSLPAGVTVNSATGALSGTPTAPGTYFFTVAASGTSGVATRGFQLTVADPPVFTSASSTTFNSNQPGSFTVTATGTPKPTLSLVSGRLPGGMTFYDYYGQISGTTTATPGDYTVVLRATSGTNTVDQTLTITVAGTVSFTSANSTIATASSPKLFTVTAKGATTPTLAQVSGKLPTGMSFNAATGELSGTPTTDGVYNLVFSATDSSGSLKQNFTLTVNSVPAFTTASSYTASSGSPVNFSLAATGYPAPTFSKVSGSLPTGLSLTSDGKIAGTVPAGTGGTYNLSFKASNGIESSDVTQNFTLTINDAPQITSGGAVTLRAPTASTFVPTATGFPAPAWSLATGTTLPGGLSLNPTTGAIIGTPAVGTGGTYTRYLYATNSSGSTSQKLELTINETATITSPNSTTVYAGKGGTFPVTATGFPLPTISTATSLPAGVTLSGGVLTVANTTAMGTYTIALDANNGIGSVIRQTFTLLVAPPVTIPSFTGISPDTGVSATDLLTSTTAITVSGSADPGASIKLYLAGALVGTATADGAGNWTATPTGLAEGANNLTATATDSSNNVSPASAVYVVNVDLTNPDSPSIFGSFPGDTGVPGDSVTSDGTLAGLSGTAEPYSTVEVLVDAETVARRTVTADKAGNWMIADIGAALSDGLHAVRVQATDQAGNTGAETFEIYTIDTVAPGAPSIGSVAGATPANPGYSRDTTVFVKGSAEPFATVTVLEGATLLGTAIADSSGLWGVSVAGLSQGARSLVAKATDAAGNAGSASTPFGILVDSIAPIAPTLTSKALVKVADGLIGGKAEAGSVVTVTLGGTPRTTTASNQGDWLLDLKAAGLALAEGANTLGLTATDAAGNISSNAGPVVTLDTTPPELVFAPVTGDDKVRRNELAAITIGGTVEAQSTVAVSLNGVPAQAAKVVGTAWTYALSSSELTALGFSTTGVTFTVTATDGAGNTTTTSRVVAVSTLGGPGDAKLLPADDTGARDNITSKQIVNIDVPVASPLKPGHVVRVVDDGGKVLAEATLTSGDLSTGYKRFTLGSVASPLPEGSYLLRGQTFDTATGDTADSTNALSLLIDNRVPGAPSTPDLAATDDTGASKSDNITSATSLSFVVRLPSSAPLAVAGDKVRIYAVGNSTPLVESSALTSADLTAKQVTLSLPLSAGSYQLYSQIITITSVLGVASGNLDVTVDTTAPGAPAAPALASASDTGVAGDSITTRENVSVDISLASTGAAAGDLLELTLGGAPAGSVVLTAGDIAMGTVTVALSAPLAQGTNSIGARLTDTAGNQGLAGATGTVWLDTIAPVAPAISLDSSTNSGLVTDLVTNIAQPVISGNAEKGSFVRLLLGSTLLGSVTADPNTGAWSITPSGSLADGVRQLFATATDAAGNTSVNSPVLAVVIDTAAPNQPGQPDLPADSDTGTSDSDNLTRLTVVPLIGSAEANSRITIYKDGNLYGTPVVADASGAWKFITGTLGDGAHVFTVEATDLAGNTSTKSAPITVTVDSAAPVAPTATVVSPDTGASPTDLITKATVLTVAGSAENNAAVLLDYGSGSASGTVSGTGAYSLSTGSLRDGSVDLKITLTDAAGNSSTTTVATATVDTRAPKATLASSAASLVSGAFVVNATFSEDVAGLTDQSFSATNGTISNFSGSGSSYSFTLTPMADGAVDVSLAQGAVSDIAGNATTSAASLARVADVTLPVATLTSLSTPRVNAPFTVKVAFSEDVSNLSLAGISVTNGKASNLVGSGNTYSFTYTPTSEGPVSVALAQGAATDAAGNGSAASQALSRTYDVTRSVATLTSTSGQRVNGAFEVAVTFDENVTGLADSGFAITNGFVARITGSGTSYTAVIQPDKQGPVTVALAQGAATDDAGNGSAATALGFALERLFDSTRPQALLSAATGPFNQLGYTVTATFGEDVTGVAESDFTVLNGAVLAGSLTGSGSVYSFTVLPSGDGKVSVALADGTVADLAGNANLASDALDRLADGTAPTAGFSGRSKPRVNAPFVVDINFSEPVTGLGLAGIAVTNGTASNLTGSGSSYSVTVTPAAEGDVFVGINAGAALDDAGNPNPATASPDRYARAYDITPPSVALSAAAGPFNKTFTITATFSEPVAGLSLEEGISATLGTVFNLNQTSADTYTFDFFPETEGTAAFRVLAGNAFDDAGNSNTVSADLNRVIDLTAPALPVVASISADTGGFGTDLVTSDASPFIIGTAEKGSFVELLLGFTVIGSGNADPNTGAFSIQPAQPLPEGANDIRARATDAAGNTGQAELAATIRVDTTAPSAQAFLPPTTVVSGPQPQGGLFSKDTTLTLSGFSEADSSVELFLDGAPTPLATVLVDNNTLKWVYTATGLADGARSFTFRAVDLAGNPGALSVPQVVTIDTIAPIAPTGLGLAPATDSGIAGDRITTNTTVTLAGVVAETAGSQVLVFVDGETQGRPTTTFDDKGTTRWTLQGIKLSVGSHSFNARAYDAAGNLGAAATPVTFDIVPGVSALPVTAPALRLGAPASFSLQGALANAIGSVSWALAQGSALPAGLALDPATGAVTGTPTAAGRGAANIVATDSAGHVATFPLSYVVDGFFTFTPNTPTAVPALAVNDPAAGTTPVTVTLSATTGLLSLPVTTGLTFIKGDGGNGGLLQFRGTLTAVNAALASLRYTSSTTVLSLASGSITMTATRGAVTGTSVVYFAPNKSGGASTTADGTLTGTRMLVVLGTDGPDVITVRPVGASTTSYIVTINGTQQVFNGITGRVVTFGFDGNDTLDHSGVRSMSRLDGGLGNDILLGGTDNDYLNGGDGADLVAGGLGADDINGGLGNDIVIDGGVGVRNTATTLRASLDTWAALSSPADADYAALTADLSFVVDNASADTLRGQEGSDWFWSSTANPAVVDILDRLATERRRLS